MNRLFAGLLWVSLAVLAILWFSGPGLESLSGLLTGLLGAVVITVVVVILLSRRWLAMNDRGVSLLFAGEPERALEVFELAQRRALMTNQRQLAAYNLGATHLTLWSVDTAIALMLPVEKRRGLRFSPAYDRILPNQLALAYAVKGDVPAAKQWLAEGERRRGDTPSNLSLLAEVIVLCRDSHPAAAARLPLSRTKDAEMMSVRSYKLLKLVEAFALHLEEPQRNAAAIDAALGGARPLDPMAVDAFTRAWPELRSFVEQKGVVSPLPVAASLSGTERTERARGQGP